MNDFGELGRYRAANARLKAPSPTENRVVFMGDSITDISTARAAAIPVIAVDFGYTDIPVRDLNADHVVSAFAELPAAVNTLLDRPVGNILSKLYR